MTAVWPTTVPVGGERRGWAGGGRRSADDLPAIGLAELNASAALLTRVDRKYVLAEADLPALWASLPPDASVLEIDHARAFAYRSTYLDTAGLDAYRASAHARRRRWKVRTRSYATGESFLEVKTRRAASTVKERIALPTVDPLAGEGTPFVQSRLAGAGIAVDAAALHPTLVTTYERTTIHLPGSGSRVTLDSGLVWELPGGEARRHFAGRVIVETKSGSTPSTLDHALWRLGHRPARISKYAVGLALLRPDLPANRWHRLLTTLAPAG